MEETRLGLAIVLTVICVMLALIAYTTQDTALLISMTAASFAAALGIGAGAFYLEWWVKLRAWQYTERRRALAITPILEAMHAAARLTEAQAALVPKFDFEFQVGFAMDKKGLEQYFIAPGVDIPMSWVEEFLQKSSDRYLWAIRNTKEGTPERMWIQAMHFHLAALGLAERYQGGPHAAAWIGDGARAQVARTLGIELER